MTDRKPDAGQPPVCLSLILITRNRREELRKTLLSLRDQDAEFELVIVDNGSDDGTLEMIAETSPDAVVVALESNAGVSGGRNRGVEASSGDILVFLDDDATFEAADALSRIRHRFEKDPGLGILATNSYLTATGEPERAAIPRRDKKVLDTDYEASYFCGVGFAVRNEIFDRIGHFFVPYVYGCEELDFSWRALDNGYKIVRAADIRVLHRRSPLERPQGRWVYCNAKNRPWLAARHLPWIYVVTHAAVWWTYLLGIALRNGLMPDYFRGVWESIRGFREILKDRNRIAPGTVEKIRDKHGRLVC